MGKSHADDSVRGPLPQAWSLWLWARLEALETMTEGEQLGEEPAREFDIAVSFAGENREYVADVVEGVKAAGFTVFYDDDHQADMWGQDGVEYLSNVYQNRARYVVFFVSRHYAEKMWTRVERRASMSRAMTERREYVLPVRLDDTELEGLLPTTFYLDANRLGLDQIVELIKQKLEGNPPGPSGEPLARRQGAPIPGGH